MKLKFKPESLKSFNIRRATGCYIIPPRVLKKYSSLSQRCEYANCTEKLNFALSCSFELDQWHGPFSKRQEKRILNFRRSNSQFKQTEEDDASFLNRWNTNRASCYLQTLRCSLVVRGTWAANIWYSISSLLSCMSWNWFAYAVELVMLLQLKGDINRSRTSLEINKLNL